MFSIVAVAPPAGAWIETRKYGDILFVYPVGRVVSKVNVVIFLGTVNS